MLVRNVREKDFITFQLENSVIKMVSIMDVKQSVSLQMYYSTWALKFNDVYSVMLLISEYGSTAYLSLL